MTPPQDFYSFRPYASAGDFLEDRCRAARLDEEFTRLSCLYAHYRRWAFHADLEATTEKFFAKKLEEATRVKPEKFRGHLLYPWCVLDGLNEEDDYRWCEDLEPKVMGQVRVTQSFELADRLIETGVILDRLQPKFSERRHIDKLNKARTALGGHLLVKVDGKRHFIVGSNVERI